MADERHLDVLDRGVESWNRWRARDGLGVEPNLSKAKLPEANLSGASLSRAYLSGAYLYEADLSEANLLLSTLVKTTLKGATLTGCRIHGISVWGTNLEGAKQWNLNVSDENEPAVMVDNLEVAQFVYLLLNHRKLRNVLNAITERGVLILGRFGGGGLELLQSLATKLRESKYQPFIFDFDRPADRNYTETVKTTGRTISVRYSRSQWSLSAPGTVRYSAALQDPFRTYHRGRQTTLLNNRGHLGVSLGCQSAGPVRRRGTTS